MFPFDPLENIGKPLVFWRFQGDQKGTLGTKGLKLNPVSDNYKRLSLLLHDNFLDSTFVIIGEYSITFYWVPETTANVKK